MPKIDDCKLLLTAIGGKEKEIVNALHHTLSCGDVFNDFLKQCIKNLNSEIEDWYNEIKLNDDTFNINNTKSYYKLLDKNLSDEIASIVKQKIGFDFTIIKLTFKDLSKLGTIRINSDEFPVSLKEVHSQLIVKFEAMLEVDSKNGILALSNVNDTADFEELIQIEIRKYLLKNSLKILLAYSDNNDFNDLETIINDKLKSSDTGWELLSPLLIKTNVDTIGQTQVIKIPVIPKASQSLTSVINFKARIRIVNLPESSINPKRDVLDYISEIFRDTVCDILEVKDENHIGFTNEDEKAMTIDLLKPAINKVKEEFGLIVRIINFSRELTEEQRDERLLNQHFHNRRTKFTEKRINQMFELYEELLEKEKTLILEGYDPDDEELENVRAHINEIRPKLEAANALPQIEYKPTYALGNNSDNDEQE